MENKFQIGVVGLGVMGANLARNFASKGFSTLVFNRTYSKTEEFLKEFGGGKFAGSRKFGEVDREIRETAENFVDGAGGAGGR
jgi:6-phosphogluconate dehydrogenase